MIDIIKLQLENIQNSKPVILNLTNYVTMDFVANALLAIGAAPIMSDSIEEIDELVSISSALYVNIGTLDSAFSQRALLACEIAKRSNKPIILDPVGAGASKIRTETAKKIIQFSNIVRGNASEIISLAEGQNFISSGVEATHKTHEAMTSATDLAKLYNNIICISGAIDLITNGQNYHHIDFGDAIMKKVTGMGCALTAIIAVFAAVNDDYYQACNQALTFYGIVGELVGINTNQSGSFKQQFIDFLNKPDFDRMKKLYEKKSR